MRKTPPTVIVKSMIVYQGNKNECESWMAQHKKEHHQHRLIKMNKKTWKVVMT